MRLVFRQNAHKALVPQCGCNPVFRQYPHSLQFGSAYAARGLRVNPLSRGDIVLGHDRADRLDLCDRKFFRCNKRYFKLAVGGDRTLFDSF
jgi:hypothetical protein